MDHEVLFVKLYSIGIRGLPLLLIQKYFRDRRKLVKINATKSELLPIEICVPKGTMLGPLLFITCINDIFEIFSDYNLIISYADDTLLLSYDATWSMVLMKLQRLVNKVNECYIENVLSL